MAHAICCSSCKIRERGVEGHPNPEDFFRPGTIPFPGHMPSAAGSFRTRRCPFRRRNLFIANKSPCALQLSPQAPTGLLGVTALHELAERRRARARSHTATLSVCWQ